MAIGPFKLEFNHIGLQNDALAAYIIPSLPKISSMAQTFTRNRFKSSNHAVDAEGDGKVCVAQDCFSALGR